MFVSDGSHLQHRLSKRQSQTKVLLKTLVTQMIIFNQGMYMFILGFKLFSILYQIDTKFLFESNNLLLIHKPQFFPYTLPSFQTVTVFCIGFTVIFMSLKLHFFIVFVLHELLINFMNVPTDLPLILYLVLIHGPR